MEILDEGSAAPDGSVVTIGAYDGVHLGHQYLIGRVRAMATDLGCASAVVTFDRHPAAVVRPASAPKLLTDLDQKLELLAETGIDHAVVIRFDQARSEESAEDFVTDVLVGQLRSRSVVVGHDFHFGHHRRGNVELLTRMGAGFGFDVHGLTLVGDGSGGPPVSSTRIRQLLTEGQVEAAAGMLGRNHQVRGTVRRGDGRGGPLLGFPTANVDVPGDICLPADGIYAGWYQGPGGQAHPAALSLGRRPTFYADAKSSLLEAYLLDFEGDLYGQPAFVRFLTRLRGEERFDSVEALVAQMGRDVTAARQALSGHT
ncbi:MAG: bifunctional riboflavin kinase/FAD synthetase [Actinomycetota bacterium]|nr:bifunctional riboflavin kinase/FAD synthetase [Actinomycetota bacterium]